MESALLEAENSVRSKGKSSKTNQIMVNNARQQVLDKMLRIDKGKAKGRYRDPALNMKPKENKLGESSGHPDRSEEIDVGVGFLG